MTHITNSRSAPVVNYIAPNKIPVAREDCGLLLNDFSAYVSTLTSGVKHVYIFKNFNLRKLPSKAKTKLDIIDNQLKWKQEFLQVCRLFLKIFNLFILILSLVGKVWLVAQQHFSQQSFANTHILQLSVSSLKRFRLSRQGHV